MKSIFPILAGIAVMIMDRLLKNSEKHPAADHPYFFYVIAALTVFFLIFLIISKLTHGTHYRKQAPFYGGVLIFLGVLHLFTAKTAVLPVLYFPSLDRVFGLSGPFLPLRGFRWF